MAMIKAYSDILWARGDSVTSIFLLKNLATPTRTVVLRLSRSPSTTQNKKPNVSSSHI